MFTTSKRKEELLKLKKENEELRYEIFDLQSKLRRARYVINDLSVGIDNDLPNRAYDDHEKARVLYQLLAINDMDNIKMFHSWVLPKDEI